MEMTNKILLLALCLLLPASFMSCDSDEPDNPSHSTNNTTTTQRISKPTFDKFLSTTDFDGFSLRVRFKTGGDAVHNIDAVVYWQAYTRKPATKPKKSDLSRSESMRMYDVTYHNTGSKKGMTNSIVFDRSHAGYHSGTYIYYYVECENSEGSAESPIDYVIVKR